MASKREITYSKIKECKSFWTWLLSEWNFTNRFHQRELGIRIFGFEFIEYLTPEQWEKRIGNY